MRDAFEDVTKDLTPDELHNRTVTPFTDMILLKLEEIYDRSECAPGEPEKLYNAETRITDMQVFVLYCVQRNRILSLRSPAWICSTSSSYRLDMFEALIANPQYNESMIAMELVDKESPETVQKIVILGKHIMREAKGRILDSAKIFREITTAASADITKAILEYIGSYPFVSSLLLDLVFSFCSREAIACIAVSYWHQFQGTSGLNLCTCFQVFEFTSKLTFVQSSEHNPIVPNKVIFSLFGFTLSSMTFPIHLFMHLERFV